MQQLEYTPSIYFNFDDTSNVFSMLNQKRDSSANFLFELSCTNQKQIIKSFDTKVNQIDLDQQIQISPPSKLKTQDFFEQFDHNFIVTFDEDISPPQNLSQTGQFGNSNQSAHHKENDYSPNPFEDGIQKIDLTLLHQNSKPSINNYPNKNLKLSAQKIKAHPGNIKDKDSSIEFEVKKRTIFKNKENIASNAQQFKITKKKLINQNTLQYLSHQTKSCRSSKPKVGNDKKCQTSQLVVTKNKKSHRDFPFNNLKIDINQHSSIFLEHKQARQSFRSSTLDSWKRKFQIQKKNHEQRTAKRSNIFQNSIFCR